MITTNLPKLIVHSVGPKMSLFLGFKLEDRQIFIDVVREAAQHDVLDALYMVPSNEDKVRVQDCFQACRMMLAQKLFRDGGYLYICGSGQIVRVVKECLTQILGSDIQYRLQGRLIQEIF